MSCHPPLHFGDQGVCSKTVYICGTWWWSIRRQCSNWFYHSSSTFRCYWWSWTWGSRFHMVPEGFQVPKFNAGTLWNLCWGFVVWKVFIIIPTYFCSHEISQWVPTAWYGWRRRLLCIGWSNKYVTKLVRVHYSIFPGERDYWFVKSFEWICIVIRLLV